MKQTTIFTFSTTSLLLLLLIINTNTLTCEASSCSGKKIGECQGLFEEEEMDSETNTRILWATAEPGKRYISYEVLKGDNVPCNKPGMPYYNCHALPKANPYTRGCSAITGCHGD